jgi:hypothetical protein
MVKEEVDEDDVAAVVARWTGIPVDRLLEGETELARALAEFMFDDERAMVRLDGPQRPRQSRSPGAIRQARPRELPASTPSPGGSP